MNQLIKITLHYRKYISHSKGMKSVPKLLVIAFLAQSYLPCDAIGKNSNVGSYGVIAKLGKDAKFAQQFENGPSNPDEKLINGGRNLEVAIYFP